MPLVENLWPLGHFMEVKPNKRDGLAVKRVTLKTKSPILEPTNDKIVKVLNRLQAISLAWKSVGRTQ